MVVLIIQLMALDEVSCHATKTHDRDCETDCLTLDFRSIYLKRPRACFGKWPRRGTLYLFFVISKKTMFVLHKDQRESKFKILQSYIIFHV